LSGFDRQLLRHRHLQNCVQEQLPWKPVCPVSMVDVDNFDTVQSDLLIAVEQAPRCRSEVKDLFIDDKTFPVPVIAQN